jgi:hypothetical protein
MQNGEITTNTTEIQELTETILRAYTLNKLQNLEEMDRFLETYKHPKLNQEDINHLNRSITHKKFEAAMKSPKKRKV